MGSIRSALIIVSITIIVVVFLPELPDLFILLGLVLITLVGLLLKRVRPFAIFLLLALLGVFWGSLYGHTRLEQRLPEAMEGLDLWLTGTIAGLPVVKGRAQRFELSVEQLTVDAGGLPVEPAVKRVRINWYQLDQLVMPGERWYLRVRLKRPHGFSNPGGFDYEAWLLEKGIGATGYVRQDEGNQRLTAFTHRHLLDQWRYRLYQQISGRLRGEPHKGLLLALLMGERGEVTDQQWTLLSGTGTNHLFVISGLHVGFVALCVYVLIFHLSRLLVLGPPSIPSQQIAAGAALLASFVYAALAGFSLPTQRALIMLVVMLSGKLLRRRVDGWHCYFLALLLVLLWDPLAPQSVGFWLSFGAVGSLLYAFSMRTSHEGFWWRWLRPQWVVFVAFVPVLLFFFQQAALLSPLANVVAIPVVGFFLVPLCVLLVVIELLMMIAGVPLDGVASLLLQTALSVLDWGAGFLKWLVGIPLSQYSNAFGVWALISAMLGVLLLLMPRGLPARWLAFFFFLPVFSNHQEQPGFGHFDMTVLDVGQGLSVHIATQNHHLIYDVGAKFNDRFNTASAVLMPYLKSRHITALDRIIISHGDNDHAGSLPALINLMPVKEVISGASQGLAKGAFECQDGLTWQWEGVRFQLMQAKSYFWLRENNRSCLLKVEGTELSVLIPGDIEARAERDLLERYGEQLQADVLLAPHHGSSTSSSSAFLDQVQPDWVIVSSGYRNRFGHPHPDVLVRYRQRQIKVLNTAQQGAVMLQPELRENEVRFIAYRQHFKRYWR